MSEYSFDPNLDTAVTMASATHDEQTRLGNLIRLVGNFDEFRVPKSITNSHEAVFRVEETAVQFGLQPNGTVEMKIKEVLPDESLERADITKESTYKLRRLIAHDGYKHMPASDEVRYWKWEDGKKKLAVPLTIYDDPEVGPFRLWGPLRRERLVAKIWNLGGLTTGRCTELIQLASEFNPVTARPAKRVR